MISDDELALALATEAGVLLLGLRDAMGFGDPRRCVRRETPTRTSC